MNFFLSAVIVAFEQNMLEFCIIERDLIKIMCVILTIVKQVRKKAANYDVQDHSPFTNKLTANMVTNPFLQLERSDANGEEDEEDPKMYEDIDAMKLLFKRNVNPKAAKAKGG